MEDSKRETVTVDSSSEEGEGTKREAEDMRKEQGGSRKEERSTEMMSMRVVTMNARSVKSSCRLTELEVEAGEDGWDVILAQETWRIEEREKFETESGHLWIGAGGPGNRHGVGILVHRKRKHRVGRVKVVLKQRALAIDLDCGGVSVLLVSAYFPHAGLKDEKVEALYAAIDGEVEAARNRASLVVIGGDFNAEIGPRQEGEDDAIVGNYGEGQRHRRGETMAKWAWASRMTIVNTMFEKPWDKKWTHRRGDRKRIIDYFCVEKKRREAVHDLEVWDKLNLG